MLRNTDARYKYGLPFALLIALNYDKTIPSPDRIIGGTGTFDFSGVATPAAVPLSIRIDTDTVMTFNLNITAGTSDPSAVTVDELVILINAAGYTDILASKEALTGYLKIEYTGTGAPTRIQVYGEAARLALIGQGKGCKYVKCDTFKTFESAPDIVASESIDTDDANNKKTTMKTDSYRKGFTGTITDSAYDYNLREIIEGGSYNSTTGLYVTPTSESIKIYFHLEIFTKRYARGDNYEGDLLDYIWERYQKCAGDMGSKTAGKNWADGVFPISGISYKDETGVITGDTEEEIITIAEYNLQNVANL